MHAHARDCCTEGASGRSRALDVLRDVLFDRFDADGDGYVMPLGASPDAEMREARVEVGLEQTHCRRTVDAL